MTEKTAVETTNRSYVEQARNHLWFQNQQYADLTNPGGALVIEKGEGIYLWDVEGNRYIDGLAGLWVVAVGHGRSELGEVAKAQMSELAYANTFDFTTPPAVALADKITSLAPGDLNRAYFVNSGSEAVEIAIKIAKQYHYNRGDKKRYKIISRIGSYHGQTAGALTANASGYAVKAPFEPLVPGAVHVPGIYCYRCPFEKTHPECDTFCARTIEDRILFEKPETIAAFISEPISIANGNHVPHEAYWKTVREICDRYGILLIADEVINGFGRTGTWFAMEQFDVVPDLMTLAKGISSGYIPLGAVLARQHVADAFLGGPDEKFASGLTFGSHPVSTAVGLANVEIIERERLVENSASTGAYLAERLRDVASRHEMVGEVRGRGLLLAMELVKNPETKEPFLPEDNVAGRLTIAMRDRGLLTRTGNLLYVSPPLTINREEADELVGIIDAAIGEVEKQIS